METVKTKICGKCKEDLPVTDFNGNKAAKDKLQTYCKKCDAERKKNYYHIKKKLKEIPTTVISGDTKLCITCKKVKLKTEFYKDNHTGDKLFVKCKECWNSEQKIKKVILLKKEALEYFFFKYNI
jgi:hypothetical protein